MSAIKKITALQMPCETEDPFLFCAFHHENYPAGNGKLAPNASLSGRNLGQDFIQKDGWAMYHGREIPGFPAHPHMGFETVTIAQRGLVDHSDSLGASGRFGHGDVQWMTAGKGVQHSEMFPMVNEEDGNPLLLFQIWLNLPAKSKNVEPYFGMFWNEDIPKIKIKDENGIETKLTLIAGSYENTKALNPAPDSWAADPQNDVNIWILELEPGATFTLPAGHKESHRSLYFYEGEELKAEGFAIPAMHRIIMNPAESLTLKNGKVKSEILLLQGKPIEEPVVKHGPFVANSREGIEEGFSRYRENEFGGWPWPKHEQVHDKTSPRFAQFPDGSVQKP